VAVASVEPYPLVAHAFGQETVLLFTACWFPIAFGFELYRPPEQEPRQKVAVYFLLLGAGEEQSL